MTKAGKEGEGFGAVVFFFFVGVLFFLLRAGPYKDHAQIYLSLFVIGFSIVALSLIVMPRTLPIIGFGRNVLGLSAIGLLSAVVFFAVPMTERIHPYLQMHIAAQQFSAAGLVAENIFINGMLLPLTEAFVFLTFFFLLYAYLLPSFGRFSSGLVSAGFTSFIFALFNVISYPSVFATVFVLSEEGAIGFFRTTIGISTALYMFVVILLGWLTVSYVPAFAYAIAVHSLIILVASGVVSRSMALFGLIMVAGVLWYYSYYVLKFRRLE